MMQISYLKKLQEDLQFSEDNRQKKEADQEALNEKAYVNKQWINALIFSQIRPNPASIKNLKKLKKPSRILKRKMRLNLLKRVERRYQMDEMEKERLGKTKTLLESKKVLVTALHTMEPYNSTLPNDGFFPPNRAPRKPRPR